MIKFFRKIRKQLLNENKVTKYFLYALGEIILVIIGILIALQINNKNETQKVEVKIEEIFSDVLVDLKSDISQATRLIDYYSRKDSITSLIRSNSLTFEDYSGSKGLRFMSNLESYDLFFVNNNAYDVLIQNLDDINPKFDNVLDSLNILYKRDKKIIENFNVKIEDLMIREMLDLSEKYPWYSEPIVNNQNRINYYLNNYQFKNFNSNFIKFGVNVHRNQINQYRLRAINTFKAISKLLNKPTDSLPFIIDKNILEKYCGIYTSNDSKSIYKFTLEKDNLTFYKIFPDSLHSEILPLSKNRFYDGNRRWNFNFYQNDSTNSMSYKVTLDYREFIFNKTDTIIK